jgi:outer membrane protein TolC
MRLFVVRLFLPLFFVCLSPLKAQAENELRLEDAVREIWGTSRQLSNQKIQAELAADDRWRRYIFNEPQFQYSNSDDGSSMSYGLSLTTTFPGKSIAMGKLDDSKALMQKAELSAKKYDLARVVVQAYLDCAGAQANTDLQRTTSADLQTVYESLKSLYEQGHSTQAEKIGSELQARQAHLDLLTAIDREIVLCKKLNILRSVDRDPSQGEAPRVKTVLPEDLDQSIINELGAETSDQSRAKAAMETAHATGSTNWWTQVPDLTFSVNRNHYIYLPASPSGKEWTSSFGISFTIPLLFPFHETVEAKRTKSQAMIDQNTAELQKVSADSDQMDGAFEYRRSQARLKELRARDLPLAEALVDSTYSAYRAGKLGYAELVLSRKTLTDLRSQEIMLRTSIINAHLRCLTQCNVANAQDTSSQGKSL